MLYKHPAYVQSLPEVLAGLKTRYLSPTEIYTPLKKDCILLFRIVFDHYKTKTFCLSAVYIKANLSHFQSQKSGKNLKNNDKRIAAELWRAKVPLSTIRDQLKAFGRILRRALAFKMVNPLNHIKSRKPMSGRLWQVSMPTRIQEVISGDENDQKLVLLCPLPKYKLLKLFYRSFQLICL
jgi:hypothetical protein